MQEHSEFTFLKSNIVVFIELSGEIIQCESNSASFLGPIIMCTNCGGNWPQVQPRPDY